MYQRRSFNFAYAIGLAALASCTAAVPAVKPSAASMTAPEHQAPPRGAMVGAGAGPCRGWTSERSRVDGWVQSAQWINGYLTSHNELTFYATKTDLLAASGYDGYSMLPKIDAYCRANPDHLIIHAAQAVWAEILDMSKPKK